MLLSIFCTAIVLTALQAFEVGWSFIRNINIVTDCLNLSYQIGICLTIYLIGQKMACVDCYLFEFSTNYRNYSVSQECCLHSTCAGMSHYENTITIYIA